MAIDSYLRHALELLPVIAFTATDDGRIDWVSPRLYHVTGISESAVLGEAWAQVVHPDDIEQVVWLWTRALESGKLWEATPRVRHADGSYHQYYTRAERIADKSDWMWVGITLDITHPVFRKVHASSGEI